MERILAILQRQIVDLKEISFSRPEFDQVKHARHIGTIEGLGRAIDLIREETRNDEDS